MNGKRLLSDYLLRLRGSLWFWIPVVVCSLLAVLYFVVSDERYSASVVVMPASESTTPAALSGLAGQVSATILGTRLGAGGDSTQRNRQILKSRRLATDFIHDFGLLQTLFPDLWDPDNEEWMPRKEGPLGLFGPLKTGPPSDWSAVDRFRDRRAIRIDELSGAISISFTFDDPRVAADVANAFIAHANRVVQQRDLEEFTGNLDYLRDELADENNPALIAALSSLIEEQMRQIMLANSRTQYAFSVVDPAIVPDTPAGPGSSLVIVLGLALGIILGLVMVAIGRSIAIPREAG